VPSNAVVGALSKAAGAGGGTGQRERQVPLDAAEPVQQAARPPTRQLEPAGQRLLGRVAVAHHQDAGRLRGEQLGRGAGERRLGP
jgi:hypothetical protein